MKPTKKPKRDYVFLHEKPIWTTVKRQKIGTSFVNFAHRKNLRNVYLYTQRLEPGNWSNVLETLKTEIPLPIIKHVHDEIIKFGYIQNLSKYNFIRRPIQNVHRRR